MLYVTDNREIYDYIGILIFDAVYGDFTPHIINNPVADTEAYTCADTCRFGCKKGLHKIFKCINRDPGSAVLERILRNTWVS